MPIYEYECKSCGSRFEKIQPVTADPISVCVNCGQGPVKRLFHAVGVIFKGSGWYITDSRKSESTPSAEKSSVKSDDSKPASEGAKAESTSSTSTTKATVADSSAD
jgi:putative FmdB family regulatory protein